MNLIVRLLILCVCLVGERWNEYVDVFISSIDGDTGFTQPDRDSVKVASCDLGPPICPSI